jgi:hypothetical protein
MKYAKDLSGQKFNLWTVLHRAENSPSGQVRYLCRCECGTEAMVHAYVLRKGHSKSCGCAKIEFHTKRLTTHGHASAGVKRSGTYRSWAAMLSRCTDENSADYKRYGARGISVCQHWSKFESFLADMGEKPTGCSIDRIDNDAGYSPSNCRWANKKQQARNTRNNTMITINGASRCISEWSEVSGIKSSSISYRLNNGWCPEDAVFHPLIKSRHARPGLKLLPNCRSL